VHCVAEELSSRPIVLLGRTGERTRHHRTFALPATEHRNNTAIAQVPETLHYRLAAPPIGKELPDLEPALPLLALLPHLGSQDLLLGLPLGARLEEVIPCLRPIPAPPALSSGSVLCLVEVLPRGAVTCLQLVKP